MLLTGLLLFLALIVAAAMSFAAEGVRRFAPSVFCPEYETLVEVKGNGCFALDDERRVGSAWGTCLRACMGEAPRKHTADRPVLRVLPGGRATRVAG
jgi:hypothetical protein